MGLSFHDSKSMVEASKVESLHFISNLISEDGTVEERRHEDFENQLSDEFDIQMVDI